MRRSRLNILFVLLLLSYWQTSCSTDELELGQDISGRTGIIVPEEPDTTDSIPPYKPWPTIDKKNPLAEDGWLRWDIVEGHHLYFDYIEFYQDGSLFGHIEPFLTPDTRYTFNENTIFFYVPVAGGYRYKTKRSYWISEDTVTFPYQDHADSADVLWLCGYRSFETDQTDTVAFYREKE